MIAISCGYCEREATVVCHHCGRPLCERHQYGIWDPYFKQEKGRSARAMHCPACLQLHHKGSAVLSRFSPKRMLRRFLPE